MRVRVGPHVQLQADARAVLEFRLQRRQASVPTYGRATGGNAAGRRAGVWQGDGREYLLLVLELLDAQRDVVLHLTVREDCARLEVADVLAEERLLPKRRREDAARAAPHVVDVVREGLLEVHHLDVLATLQLHDVAVGRVELGEHLSVSRALDGLLAHVAPRIARRDALAVAGL